MLVPPGEVKTEPGMTSHWQRWLRNPDVVAGLVLAFLTTLVMAHRWYFDNWLGRHDILAFFLPWYGYLGERLRDFQIPGWNPYMFAGTPMAGDPESGWMYFPAMIAFTLFSIATAMKVFILIQLLIAASSTYIFSRVLGFGALAAFAATAFYEFGTFLSVQTNCCTVGAQITTWIPVTFLGIELALRARRWSMRFGAWALAGIGVSQYFAAWPGQGLLYALMLTAGWGFYRAVLSPPVQRDIKGRLVSLVTTGGAVIVLGAGIAAAGFLPRLQFVSESINPNGDYAGLWAGGNQSPLQPFQIFTKLLWDRDGLRSAVILILLLMAPFLARRKYAVPFFAVATAAPLILALKSSPLHDLLFLVHEFKIIHEHSPTRILWIGFFGASMLAGATIQVLGQYRHRARYLPVVLIPLAAIIFGMRWMSENKVPVGWPIYLTTGLTVAALAVIMLPTVQKWPVIARTPIAAWRIPGGVSIVNLVIVVVILLNLNESVIMDVRKSFTDTHTTLDDPALMDRDQWVQDAVAVALDDQGTGGAGGFLLEQQATQQPFRYFGYGSQGYKGGDGRSYPARRLEDPTLAILANGRSMILGLSETQGYNPLQLMGIYNVMFVVNWRLQNYHLADVLASGVDSPLLDMLAVRYVLIDANLPLDRPDIDRLIRGKELVFTGPGVLVYENPKVLPPAWIVHNVQVQPDPMYGLIEVHQGRADPRTLGFVEKPLQGTLQPPTGPESATVTRYDPEHITIQANASANGFLVLSEIYEEGWVARIDGKKVDVYRANGALRGIELPAGTHTIDFTYEPKALKYGLMITGVSSLVAIAGLGASGLTWYGDRKRDRPESGELPEPNVPAGGPDPEPTDSEGILRRWAR